MRLRPTKKEGEDMGNENFHNPKLTVDAIALREDENEIQVLLIRRGREPWKGFLAFPGGFVEHGEDPEDSVVRELLEETGVSGNNPSVFAVLGHPSRDPRGHIVSVFYKVSVNPESVPVAGDDADGAEWKGLNKIKDDEMAADHITIIELLRD